MPDPTNPDEAECQICFDNGYVPGTDRLCSCRGEAPRFRCPQCGWNVESAHVPGSDDCIDAQEERRIKHGDWDST